MKAYELATIDADGNYECVGDEFASLEDAYARAKDIGPGTYAVGEADAGHYIETLIIREDGRAALQRSFHDRWYDITI